MVIVLVLYLEYCFGIRFWNFVKFVVVGFVWGWRFFYEGGGVYY